MALNPVNYSQYLQGTTTAAESMFGDVMKAREYSQAQKAAEAEAQKKAQMDELILRFARGSNPSLDDYVTLSAMTTDKAQAAKLNKIWGEKTKAQQNSELLRLSNIFSVLGVKDIELAKNYIQEAADADPKNAEQYAAAIKVAEMDPDLARSGVASILVNIPGGKDALNAILKNEEDRRKAEMQPFEIEAKKAQSVPSSIREAIGFDKLNPEAKETFIRLQTLKKPSPAITNIDLGKSVDEKGMEGIAKLLPEFREKATASATQIDDIKRYRQAIEDKAITGPGAEKIRLPVAILANMLGITGVKGEKQIRATRTLLQGLSNLSLNARKLMQGQGAITGPEQDLLREAQSGRIEYTKPELQTLFGIFDRASRATYQQNYKLLKSAADSGSFTAKYYLDSVPMLEETKPESAPPQQAPSGGFKLISTRPAGQ